MKLSGISLKYKNVLFCFVQRTICILCLFHYSIEIGRFCTLYVFLHLRNAINWFIGNLFFLLDSMRFPPSCSCMIFSVIDCRTLCKLRSIVSYIAMYSLTHAPNRINSNSISWEFIECWKSQIAQFILL